MREEDPFFLWYDCMKMKRDSCNVGKVLQAVQGAKD